MLAATQEYTRFSKAMGLSQQRERVQVGYDSLRGAAKVNPAPKPAATDTIPAEISISGVDKNQNGGIIKSRKKFSLQYFSENDVSKQTSNSLKRGIRTYAKRIAQHEGYIRDPKSHCPDWDSYDDVRKAGLIKHWNKEITNFKVSIDNRKIELKKRGDLSE